jgi:hypothetical protein
MRRHSPRASPSCTRVFGPMEATIRDFLLGSARTITQFLAMVLVHRDAAFRERGDADAFGATATRGAAFAGGRTTPRVVAREGAATGGRTAFRAGARTRAGAGTGSRTDARAVSRTVSRATGTTGVVSTAGAGSGSAIAPADCMEVIESDAGTIPASIGCAIVSASTTLADVSRATLSTVFSLAKGSAARAESGEMALESGLRRPCS